MNARANCVRCGIRWLVIPSGLQLTWGRLVRFGREPLADYLLDKNPQAGAKIRVDVDGETLEIAD